jgi:ferredoxin-nitrite reductase
MNDQAFSEEQKRYLEGFTSGMQIAQRLRGLPATGSPAPAGTHAGGPAAPESIHHEAQDRAVAAGGRLTAEERAKRERHPLDRWDELAGRARAGQFPKGTDVFCTKFFGLFYVAPAQDSYMCRLRLPNGIVSAHQFRGIADLTERYGGGYCHVTTRANLQIREIGAADATHVLTGLYELGIVNRGAGADNIRNVTGSPTAGIDPQEIIDTRPLARELHYHILNHRELYGLPRKFNIAFDGGGTISVLEDTNDIGFAAVRVTEGKSVPPGVYFRLQLGGITGHKDFARDTGFMVKPEQCTPVADAIVRVFIREGDRTDRTKARLKYVLDRMGLEPFMEETAKLLPFSLLRLNPEECDPRLPARRDAHVGIHPQRQDGLYYIGLVLPVGRLDVRQMRGLADIAERLGSGTLRLTVWQNLLISDIPEARLEEVKQAIRALDLDWNASSIRAGLVACTGNTGCKFSASDTKRHAMEIAGHLERRLKLDLPINIHLTGCHHSCAQHYIGDIGLLGCKIERGDETIEGYHVYVGGGFGSAAQLAAEIRRDVPAEELPRYLEELLGCYLQHRADRGEGFADFVRRVTPDGFRKLLAQAEAQAA